VLKRIGRGLSLVLLSLTMTGCTSLFFYPMEDWVQNPARQGLAYEDVVLIHEDGLRIHGWWLPAKGEVQGTVYFLHGNAQNISTHMMNVAWLPDAGYQVFMLDYRGYGLSEGEPSLPEVFSDIRLGLNWLHNSGRLGEAPLIVFGQSLGGAMGVKVLAEEGNPERVDCVLLEAVFSGYPQITRDAMSQSWLLWPFQWPVAALMPDQWNPEDYIGKLAGTPLFLMHSSEDQIVPLKHGRALFDAAGEPKAFRKLEGDHIAGSGSQEVQGDIRGFLQRHCPAPEKDQDVSAPGELRRYRF